MADLTGQAREASVEHDPNTDKVVSVTKDTVITDPEHELAVQVPPEGDGTVEDPLGVHVEPTPEEVFADEDYDEKAEQEREQREADLAEARKREQRDAEPVE